MGLSDVILQGFHWHSCKEKNGWYNIINENVDRIHDGGFTYIWFPPPSKSMTEDGYTPTELYNLDSCYGNYQELRDVISNLGRKGIKSICDIVISHRNQNKDLSGFENPDWSTHTIVADDPNFNGEKSVNTLHSSLSVFPVSDVFLSYSNMIDHKHLTVQYDIKRWMKWLRWEVGFAGWRYDHIKTIPAWAISMYNQETEPDITFGEYWDNHNKHIEYINANWEGTSAPQYAVGIIDIVNRYEIKDAVISDDYQRLEWFYNSPLGRPAGLMGQWADKSFTFINNHDTQVGNFSNRFSDHDGEIERGYAYILTHPGTPIVFWQDYFDRGERLRSALTNLSWIRRHYGICSDSKMHIDVAFGNLYAAYIAGANGEIAIKLGSGDWSPPGGSKWTLLYSGESYAIWGDNGKWWIF